MKFTKGDKVIVIVTGEELTVARYAHDTQLGYLVQVVEENRVYQEEMLKWNI